MEVYLFYLTLLTLCGNNFRFRSLRFGLALVCLGCLGIFVNEQSLVVGEETANGFESANIVNGCTPVRHYDYDFVWAECKLDAPDLRQQLPYVFQSFIPSYKGEEISWEMQIYQWNEIVITTESCTQSGGQSSPSTCTTNTRYEYKQEWVSTPIDTSDFKRSYENVGSLPNNVEKTGKVEADEYSLIAYGRAPSEGFALDKRMTGQIPDAAIPLQSAVDQSFHSEYAGGDLRPEALNVVEYNGDYVLETSNRRSRPRIGDLRISFRGKSATEVSVCGKQAPMEAGGKTSSMLTAYPLQIFDLWGRKTYEFEKLFAGRMSKEDFIDSYHKNNKRVANTTRIYLYIVMIAACCSVWTVLHDVESDPLMLNSYTSGIAGDFIDAGLQAGICLASCGSAAIVYVIVLVVSWLFVHHPTLSIVLAFAGGGAVCFAKLKKAAKGRELAAECYIKIDGGLNQQTKIDFVA